MVAQVIRKTLTGASTAFTFSGTTTVTDVATGTNSGRYVRSIQSASDAVMQM